MTIERFPVTSSNVVSLGYHAPTATMEVEHKSGVYRSAPVSVEEFQAVLGAPSIGRAVNELRKNPAIQTHRVEQGAA